MLIGREAEKTELNRAIGSPHAELVVVYGRRRVGKTFLIRQHLRDSITFELVGLHNAELSDQLANFANRLSECFRTKLAPPHSWLDAFQQLKQQLSQAKKERNQKKRVLFIDEFPWLATRKSGFVSAFEEFWNGYAVKHTDLMCVICGSAASWMIDKVISSKGGLHNRATSTLRLSPFTLGETREFLRHAKVTWTDMQIAEWYFCVGGIPHYLQHVKKGKSVPQTIDELCFQKSGLLHNEFDKLYGALFERPENHLAIVRALAHKQKGLGRNELLKLSGLNSGGTLTKALNELAESGFIREFPALYTQRKHSLWRLTDHYSLFYLSWIEGNRTSGKQIWQSKVNSPKWRTWSGYAFENLCLLHVPQIKRALGISGVLTEEASWQYAAANSLDEGAQIDLAIDRNDQSINLCEMKYSNNPFMIDKKYAAELERKLRVFRTRTGTRKALFLTLVTANGLKPNPYSINLLSNQVELSDLFATA